MRSLQRGQKKYVEEPEAAVLELFSSHAEAAMLKLRKMRNIGAKITTDADMV